MSLLLYYINDINRIAFICMASNIHLINGENKILLLQQIKSNFHNVPNEWFDSIDDA